MKDSGNILKEIKRIIKEKAPSAKIYLYGSRVRGTARSESDWDILILLNKEIITLEIKESITYPLYDLEGLQTIFTGEDGYIKKEVSK